MKLALLVVLLSVSAAACAQDSVVLTLGSHHMERKGYCEVNPGAGWERVLSPTWRAMAGFYSNSFCDRTLYIGAWRTWLRTEHFEAGVATVAATGYGPLRILPVPVLKWSAARDWHVNLFWAPSRQHFLECQKCVFGLQLEFPLGGDR